VLIDKAEDDEAEDDVLVAVFETVTVPVAEVLAEPIVVAAAAAVVVADTEPVAELEEAEEVIEIVTDSDARQVAE
jgi:hypothetical protein